MRTACSTWVGVSHSVKAQELSASLGMDHRRLPAQPRLNLGLDILAPALLFVQDSKGAAGANQAILNHATEAESNTGLGPGGHAKFSLVHCYLSCECKSECETTLRHERNFCSDFAEPSFLIRTPATSNDRTQSVSARARSEARMRTTRLITLPGLNCFTGLPHGT